MKKASKVRLPEAAFFEDEAPAEPEEERPDSLAASRNVERVMNPELIKREVLELIRKGTLPEGFEPAEAMRNPGFVQLLTEMPAKYAVRVYAAEKRADEAEKAAMMKLAARLKNREELPKSARAGATGVAGYDYANMSDEQFAALERHLKEQAHRGINVRL